jgi:uncharacterized membrane protein
MKLLTAAVLITAAGGAVEERRAPRDAGLPLELAAERLGAAAEAWEAGRLEEVEGALREARAAFDEAQRWLGRAEELRLELPVFPARSSKAPAPEALRRAAASLQRVGAALRQEPAAREAEPWAQEIERELAAAWAGAERARKQDARFVDPFQVLSILLAVLALLFLAARHPRLGKVFKVVPLLVFAYFVPTLLSNLRIIPIDSILYDLIRKHLLPASLVLLVLAVDIPAILRLGRQALILFLAATASIVIGGPLAYLACAPLIPEALGDEAWKGLAALSGSWIGGGANFIAIGASVGASATTISRMVVVDVAVASVWMACLLFFAGRERRMDEALGADRTAIDALRAKVERFEKEIARPATLSDLLLMLAIAFGTTAAAAALAERLPEIGDIVGTFTWTVLIVTAVALALSFTRVRSLDGAGASKLGSAFLYLLVVSIGAHAEFSGVLEAPALVAVGAVWMAIHAAAMLLVRRKLRAPIFFAAVGSQANVGGAASAPIVAGAFHPALAPVGVLLAVGGYVLGTYAGLLCAVLLRAVHELVR